MTVGDKQPGHMPLPNDARMGGGLTNVVPERVQEARRHVRHQATGQLSATVDDGLSR